jgi:hypothetical protein
MNATHGMTDHPLYQLWKGMHARCRDENHVQYHDYGARGIAVCGRWSGTDGFKNFVTDMGDRPSAKHTIDRQDNDGPYSKDNCRWSTRKQNARNKRNNRLITAFGRTLCLAAWAEETGLAASCILYRLDTDWPAEKALSTPSRKKQ